MGHDEPSVLFYSNRPGSGNDMTYRLKLPSDPSGPYSPSKSYNIELRPAFWFGMAMCDTQSYGSTLPHTIDDFGGNSTAEFGPLHGTDYDVFGGGGATALRYNNFERVLPYAPC